MELGAEQVISWAMFKNEFNGNFFQMVVQEARAQKFMDPVLGGMFVTDRVRCNVYPTVKVCYISHFQRGK
jgi:hypothetical protein